MNPAMSIPRSINRFGIYVLTMGVALLAWTLCESTAFGQSFGHGGGRHGAGGKGRQAEQSDSLRNYRPLSHGALTPHGGEYISTETNYYEVVYIPLQTRIYYFDKKLKPLSARDVRVQMSLQLPMENAPRRIAFQYVAMPSGAIEQDYVVAQFDIRPLQDKETRITLEFSGIPDHHSGTASFTPYYPRFSIRPYVAKVLLTDVDRDGIARQKTCPVSGAPLGSRGPVTKLYIADFPLYVAGDDCIAAIKEAPQKFLPR